MIFDQAIKANSFYRPVRSGVVVEHDGRQQLLLGADLWVCFWIQEEERRIALVMARKEEEKKRESNKTNIMKVSYEQA